MLGPFIAPKLPQKGQQFEVRVKHLLTPNEVATEHTDNIMYKITDVKIVSSVN